MLLRAAPSFLLHRVSALAPTADPGATLADYVVANYPLLGAFDAKGWKSVLAHWTADGAALGDTVTLEPLVWNGTLGVWTRLATVEVAARRNVELPLRGASTCLLRLHAVAFGGVVTNFKLYVSAGEPE